MHHLQTVVTTLQAVMPTSQPVAVHCVTKTSGQTLPPRAGDAALWREWSGSRDNSCLVLSLYSSVKSRLHRTPHAFS